MVYRLFLKNHKTQYKPPVKKLPNPLPRLRKMRLLFVPALVYRPQKRLPRRLLPPVPPNLQKSDGNRQVPHVVRKPPLTRKPFRPRDV